MSVHGAIQKNDSVKIPVGGNLGGFFYSNPQSVSQNVVSLQIRFYGDQRYYSLTLKKMKANNDLKKKWNLFPARFNENG